MLTHKGIFFNILTFLMQFYLVVLQCSRWCARDTRASLALFPRLAIYHETRKT